MVEVFFLCPPLLIVIIFFPLPLLLMAGVFLLYPLLQLLLPFHTPPQLSLHLEWGGALDFCETGLTDESAHSNRGHTLRTTSVAACCRLHRRCDA